MTKNHLKSLTNNLGWKLLAVVLAFIFWLVVYNIDDPIKTKSFTTNVVIENEKVITDMNKYYEVLDGSNQVTFSVSAKRSVLDKLEDGYFTASADMSTLVLDSTGTVGTVELKISSSKYESSLKYSSKSKYLRIALEDLMSKQFVITAGTSGTVADGYALGDVTLSGSNILKVSGPASVVEQISTAVATINVDGVSTTVSDSVIPTLYAEDGTTIDTTKLTLNIQSVDIEATVLGTKEVPIVIASTGDPMTDYAVIEITSDPETIMVKGNTNALNSITTLNVPGDLIDVSGLSAGIETTIDVTPYLPDGVTLVDSNDAVINVYVDIEMFDTKVYNISVNRIQVEGLGANMEIGFEDSSIAVTLGGTTESLENLAASDIALTLDASGLSKGTHNVELSLGDDMGIYTLVSGKVKITITDVGSAGADAAIGAGTGTDTTGKTDSTGDATSSDSKTTDNGDTTSNSTDSTSNTTSDSKTGN